jgi:hypothetical protein
VSVRIEPRMLDHSHVARVLDKLVQTLSEDVAGVHYSDPGVDDLNLLDEELRSGVRAMLLEIDLPEQTLRGEAALHERSDQDYQKASGL